MTRTVDMTLEVVWMMRSELALGTKLCTIVEFGAMLLALRVYFLAYAVYTNNSARHVSPR